MADPVRKRRLEILAGLCLVAVLTGPSLSPVHAQETRAVRVATASPHAPTTSSLRAPLRVARTKPAPNVRLPYYVDFRARTAASYGHAFIWFGRTNDRKVEVAGLHPATDSVIPYILGHFIPVPSETGASYGDLDEQYLTASYRIFLTEAEAKKVFAYIKHKQKTSPLWNAATYNCIMFISHIAEYMGLRVPGSHLLLPEDWVKELRALNGGKRRAQMSMKGTR